MRVQVAALLVTDLVDSTALVRELGDLRAAGLGARHDDRARDAFARHGGREIDKSDGFLVMFEDVGAAVGCAIEYHAVLRTLSEDTGVALLARAGVHLGEVVLRENTPEAVARGAKPLEVEGLAKVVAARLMGLAQGGRTLLSAAAALQARRELEDQDLRWTVHGAWVLKGAGEFEVHEVGPPGAPPHGPLPPGPKAQPTGAAADLPGDDGVLVGRREHLADLEVRFAAGARLVTLLGPGGTGKTRLAVRLARIARDAWPDGAWFCDLTGARDAATLCVAVARGLGVPLKDGEPGAQLGRVLAGRGRALVVLDNVEQVIDAAARLIPRWLEAAPQVAFLATSREALRLHAEQVVPLAPLDVPDEDADLEEIRQAPAVVLFATRARALDPSFTIHADNARDIAQIVRHLDGIPLAVELAAARTRSLAPDGILARMSQRLDLLRSGNRDTDARHATLRAAIDWSWGLLSPAEREVLAACSTFRGVFDLHAAEAVVGPAVQALPAEQQGELVVDLVQALVDKSLARSRRGEGSRRFSLYETVREYAREVLKASPAAVETDRRHGLHYARLGSEEAIGALRGPEQHQARRALALARDNLQAAAYRAIRRKDAEVALPCAVAMLALAEAEGPYDEAIAVATRAEALPGGATPTRIRLRSWLSLLCREAGRHEDAQAAADGARALAEQHGEPLFIALAMAQQGVCLAERGALLQAQAVQRGALAVAKAAGNRWMEARIAGQLAITLERQGAVAAALPLYQQAEATFRQLGDARMLANVTKDLGDYHRIRGDLEAARTATEGAIAMAAAVGDRRVQATALGNLAEILLETGRLDRARARAEEALVLHEQQGARLHAAHLRGVLGELLAEAGQHEAARVQLDLAEAELRDSPTSFLYAVLLVRRALALHLAGQRDAARQALARAQAVDPDFAHGPQSEFGRAWGRVAARLNRG